MTSAELLKKYLDRAKREHGIVRKAISLDLDIKRNNWSNWTSPDPKDTKLPLSRIRDIAEALKLSRAETIELALCRLAELHNRDTLLDSELIAQLIEAFMPDAEEQFFLDALHGERERLGYWSSIEACEENRATLAAAMNRMITREAAGASQ